MEAFGHNFRNPALLLEALTHPSFSSEQRGAAHYERLEFLGDSVLGLLVSEALIAMFPQEPEGALAKRRAALVCREALAQVARRIGLGARLRLGSGEQAAGGRENPATLENALEALIGALYLDGGLDAAKLLVESEFLPMARSMGEPPKDPKTTLQEWAQARGLPVPSYEIRECVGPSHAPLFTVAVRVDGCPEVTADGPSRRKAERDAAEKLLIQVAGQTADQLK